MKKIEIDSKKCTGCRTCEVVCSFTHNKGLIEPRRSRVRVYRDDVEGIFSPIIAGPKDSIRYVDRPKFLLGGQEGDIDILWSLFTDGSRRCNVCGNCVKWCVTGALSVREV